MAAEPRTRPASGAPSSNGHSPCAPAITVGDPPALTPQHLTDGLRDTESKAQWIAKTIDQFEGPLIRYAARITGDLDRGRDVVQETFLRLCREPDVALSNHLAQWLFTVCRRLSIDIRRKEMRMHAQSDSTMVCDVPSPDTAASSREQDDELRRVVQAIDALPANQQEVVRLKFQEGMAYREIAAVTGLSVSNVGYLLHIAVKTLRERMTANE